jgi:hypothetical protein
VGWFGGRDGVSVAIAITAAMGCRLGADEGTLSSVPDPSVSSNPPSTSGDAGMASSAPVPSSDAGAAGAVPEDASSSSAPPIGTSNPTSPTPPAGADAGGSCAGAVVCDDFESYPAGALELPDAGGTWQIEYPNCSGTSAMAIDTMEAHSGTRSIKVSGAAGYCNHAFLGTNAVASVTGTLWMRFYVRLGTPLDADHATFLAMHDTTSNNDLRMGGQDSVLMWNRASDDATLPAMSPAGTALSVVPTAQAWHCVEAAIDGAAATLETWVDGMLVIGLVGGGAMANATADGQWVSTAWAPHLVDARFGWESYAGEAETVWFDDIAIGPARLGCGE